MITIFHAQDTLICMFLGVNWAKNGYKISRRLNNDNKLTANYLKPGTYKLNY